MNDRFLRACRREPVDATPVWFMRQAGRYMADYRALRKRYSLLDICREPELAVAVTLQPVDVIDVDAAILFSDLLVPFTPLGLDFEFVKGEGPSIHHPIRAASDVERLRRFDPREALAHVLETIRILRHELRARVPLIGFGGAPFTLAAYAIEGGPSTSYLHTKQFMYAQPQAWHRLCARLADLIGDYMAAQIEAGAQAIQIFDSWAGALGRNDYREFALPHTRAIFDRLRDTGVPLIHFGVGAAAILEDLAEAGGDVIGLDWRQPIDEAWLRISDRAVQGNLDPALLLGPRDRLFAATDDVLRRAGGRPGHVFNLGHGVLPSTPLEHLQELAKYVHRETLKAER
ncbi:MAG TPA: uroporphyrinogen decarboxylase [Vicinamibacterales bacterium]|nr:uroporphyrinogen decarboxylase [Vicinamibacterales bacterium]